MKNHTRLLFLLHQRRLAAAGGGWRRLAAAGLAAYQYLDWNRHRRQDRLIPAFFSLPPLPEGVLCEYVRTG